jgi:3-deoxy-manno-octulosonate cytidylyltransferase (CMP-KDO synthetase)
VIPSFDIIIPARFGSKRLPGKPLRDIGGKTLIQRVYECACSSSAESVTVATDDPGISRVAKAFGANVCLTSAEHECGTDRIAEAAEKLSLENDRIIVNLQGDEPQMPGALIDQVAETLVNNPTASLATASGPLEGQEDYESRDVVKVVCNKKNVALYFSRSPIPWCRSIVSEGGAPITWSIIRRHIGLYAYRVSYLKDFVQQDSGPLEQAERLEQLRALWNAQTIVVCDAVQLPGPGVDTLTQLEAAIRFFS